MAGVIQLPAGWGEAEILAAAPRIRCGQALNPHAYDHFGNCLRWIPSSALRVKKLACDLEDGRRDSSFMAARFGVAPGQFPQRWVASEVLAKLTGMPILLWLKTYGLFACNVGVPVRAEIPDACAELMVLADGAHIMAFGFLT